MPTITTSRQATTEFDTLYRDLAEAWMSHQALKASGAPLGELADSNARLFRLQMAMGAWQRRPRG